MCASSTFMCAIAVDYGGILSGVRMFARVKLSVWALSHSTPRARKKLPPEALAGIKWKILMNVPSRNIAICLCRLRNCTWHNSPLGFLICFHFPLACVSPHRADSFTTLVFLIIKLKSRAFIFGALLFFSPAMAYSWVMKTRKTRRMNAFSQLSIKPTKRAAQQNSFIANS